MMILGMSNLFSMGLFRKNLHLDRRRKFFGCSDTKVANMNPSLTNLPIRNVW